jgi:hypothetical protein
MLIRIRRSHDNTAMTITWNVSLGRILPLPILIKCMCCLGQPRAIFAQFENLKRRIIPNPILRRVAQRFQQPCGPRIGTSCG